MTTIPSSLESHTEWEHRARIPEAVQQEVLERDNAQCQLCGTSGENKLQLHHWKHFRSHGGAHVPENLVTLCWKCHADVHEGRQDVMLLEVWPGRWFAFPGI